MQRIAQGQGKTCAGLRVILQILQEWRRQVQSLAAENLRLSCLVKIKLSRVNRKTQLVQAKQAELPKTSVVNLAFFQSDFAPDHLIACGGISCEFNSPDIILLALVHVDVEEDQLFILVKGRVGNRSEVDVSQFTI